MKKSILFVLCFAFFTKVFATDFTFNLSERNIPVQNDNGLAVFDWSNAVSVDVPGDPALPVYVVDFILPDDADMDSVSVDIINGSADVLTGNFDVFPTAPIEPENSERYWPVHPENIDENGRNRQIYGGNGFDAYNGFLHNNWKEKVVKHKWKSVKFVKVFVRAYDWNPATQKLKKLTGGTLRVSFTSSSNNNSITLPHFSPITAMSLGSLMQNTVNKGDIRIQNIISTGNTGNFPLLHSFMQGQAGFGGLAVAGTKPTLYIITTDDIRKKSRMLGRFIDSKNKKGFSVAVVMENETIFYNNGVKTVNEGWSRDSMPQKADQIRDYLKYRNRYEKIDYLLLIGNPHPGSCNVTNADTDLNFFKDISRETDCLYNGTKEGDIPMKWINLDAYSTFRKDYCIGYDESTKTCDGRWMKANDLRRAFPSDIYYSALSKEWDPNDNGLIGESDNEVGTIFNDVMLGRIPVYKDNNNDLMIDDLDRYLQKVIRYENTLKTFIPPTTINNIQNPNSDTIETLRHNIFAMANYMDNHEDRDETPNWIFAEYLNNLPINHSFNFDFMFRNDDLENWTYPIASRDHCQTKGTFKIWQSENDTECVVNKYYSNVFTTNIDDNLLDINGNLLNNVIINTLPVDDQNNTIHEWSGDDAAQKWADGKYGIVLWSSHGWRQGALIDRNNTATLEDYYPVHTFQASCQTGWPEDPNNLATSLLKHGAVTTIAASRNAWGYSTKFENGVFQLVSEGSRQRSSQELALQYLNRFLMNESAGFSFARAIEEFSEKNENKHNEIIFNLYGDPTLGITSWQESGEDSDQDGIIDEFDNCPNIYNPEQLDADLDLVGDDCDNCPNNYNSLVENNSEIVVAQCEFYFNNKCAIGGAGVLNGTKKYAYKNRDGKWVWQPDHDLDGTGDACDDDTVWSDFLGIPKGTAVLDDIVTENSNLQMAVFRMNETLSVSLNMKKSDYASTGIETATTRYCWLTEDEFGEHRWGTDGYCTTEEKHKTDFSEYCDTNFGYSHGTDPQPIDYLNTPSWKDPKKSGEFTKIETQKNEVTKKIKGSARIDWDWRYDFKQDRFSDIGTSLDSALECGHVSGFGFCDDGIVPKFYYTMSTGAHGTAPNYLTQNNEINPDFFKNNLMKYARSSRLSIDPIVITYHKERVPYRTSNESCTGNCSFPIEEWHDMIIDRLIHGPRPYEMPGMEHYFKNAYGSDLINTGVAFREWSNNSAGMPSVIEKNRPMYLLTITENASGMNEGILAVPNNTVFSLRNIQESTSNLTFEITAMDLNSNGDWRTQGVLSNVPAGFMPTASANHDGTLYVVSKNSGDTAHIYQIAKTDQIITPPHLVDICALRWIFEPIDLGTLPNLSNITIHSVGNSLLALGKTTSGMKVYKLSEQNGNPYFEDISGTILPEGRDVYNVEIQDDVLYLAGGAGFGENSADLKTDIWSFTETDGWQLIRNDINMFPVTLRIDFDGDNIILTDRVIRPNGTTNRAIFPADGTGDIVIETVPVEGANVQGFGDYCLKETGTALQGGIETSGECVPFTHPWYNSFSAGATVYSLDGKSDRLFVGTNNAIKVYDISDPTSPVLVSSFSTSSRVNDLEVYGDTLFAATNGGLYKLDASNDTLTQTLFISTFLNSQYKVEVYNGKLYVGDDNGIKVRDLETLSVLTSVNNGSVLDFAIENGEIGLYKDALFSPVEIRDADTLALKANEFFGCFEIEVGSSGGRFYLSCDDETYRFEDDGDGGVSFTELSGDIRELQDVYTFDGYTYFYDENTIWISTSNDVPAICGNGIVEGDEVCDGGQIDCEELDSNYVSGTATCNSTCDGYNTNNCSDDGW